MASSSYKITFKQPTFIPGMGMVDHPIYPGKIDLSKNIRATMAPELAHEFSIREFPRGMSDFEFGAVSLPEAKERYTDLVLTPLTDVVAFGGTNNCTLLRGSNIPLLSFCKEANPLGRFWRYLRVQPVLGVHGLPEFIWISPEDCWNIKITSVTTTTFE